MVIVAMENVWANLHRTQPMQNRVLKCYKLLTLVPITINTFPIQKSWNLNQIKVKTERIAFLFENLHLIHIERLMDKAIKDNIKLVAVKKRLVVPRHYHAGIQAHLVLIFWQSSYYICQSTDFRHWITFHRKVKYFHINLLDYLFFLFNKIINCGFWLHNFCLFQNQT